MSTAAPGAAVRALAARTLAAVLVDGRSLKAELARDLPTLPDPRDRALAEALCFEVLRHHRRYAFVLSTWLQKPLQTRDAALHALLLCGLAQLDALKLPAHAAVAATADAARLLKRESLVGLVNAVLRRASREPWPASGDVAVDSSHPDWLVDTLRADWPEDADAILAGNNRQAPLWLRPNRRNTDRDALLAAMRDADLEPHASSLVNDALWLDDGVPVDRLPGWRNGDVVVQDGAAQLAVQALAPRDGERVLDACAAPGGKAAQIIAARERGETQVIDIDPRRLRQTRDRLRELGLLDDGVDVRAADAADPAAWWDGRAFDAVLLDAPCSATGIIRRQPDIKWHRRPADIAALVALQARLLDALWPLVAPGGRLLYATCSVLRDENDRQVAAFLARTPGARLQPLDARHGRDAGHGHQRFPGDDGMDGFFYALLLKSDA